MTKSREQMVGWIAAGLRAVEPRDLVANVLDAGLDHQVIIAIGKAAPAMSWGVAAITSVEGICVTGLPADVPEGVELVIGDHPIPGRGSLEAGERALDLAESATLVLLSGGGSSLCEAPIPGLDLDFVARVNRRLLETGLPIDLMNLARSHISRVKCGGLGGIRTLVLSDVAGLAPGVVSSGPTSYVAPDPDGAISILRDINIDMSSAEETAIRDWPGATPSRPDLVVIGDAMTAAHGVRHAVNADGLTARVHHNWISGNLERDLDEFLSAHTDGVSIAVGEPTVAVRGPGRGGRNTHAALLAAKKIAGSDLMFAALATDGTDGSSGVSGAVVDGSTVSRGGDPDDALNSFDSASYLDRAGDAYETGPTGTNVADLWLLWGPSWDGHLY